MVPVHAKLPPGDDVVFRRLFDEDNNYYWLKCGPDMQEQEVAQPSCPELIEAERKLALISQDRQARVDYERRRMAYHDAIALRRDSWLEGFEAGMHLSVEELKRIGMNEGRRIAWVEMLTEGLSSRGFLLSDAQCDHINAEADLSRLKSWVSRVHLAPSVEALLSS